MRSSSPQALKQDRPARSHRDHARRSQLTLAGVRGTQFDIADVITRPDYGDPYALVDKLLDSRVIRAVGNTNISYFASPQVRSARSTRRSS